MKKQPVVEVGQRVDVTPDAWYVDASGARRSTSAAGRTGLVVVEQPDARGNVMVEVDDEGYDDVYLDALTPVATAAA